MKKVCALFLSFFTMPAMASGIDATSASAPCDNVTLSKYTGTADIEINWEPNTIGLTWYDGNTQLSVPVASQTCTYDGMITVPEQPTKPGYTFNGWKIPKIDFSTIPTNVNGTNRWSITWYNNANVCNYDTTTGGAWSVDCNSDSTYNELQTYEWKVRYNHGDLYGVAGCSPTNGAYHQPGVPIIENGTGQYCWCKATGYKTSDSNVISLSEHQLPWVAVNCGCSLSCAQHCAGSCSHRAEYNSEFRAAIFTPASN